MDENKPIPTEPSLAAGTEMDQYLAPSAATPQEGDSIANRESQIETGVIHSRFVQMGSEPELLCGSPSLFHRDFIQQPTLI